ncbi:MAG: hypothetical protein COB66_05005 [Coxiella sp. (in: Bacteria)]|nr:MAG: hypothetical protein COB66_05005 [Coxiella sp. (in: g-proteobacteria)]
MEIVDRIFNEDSTFTVCIKFWDNDFSKWLTLFRSLRDAGIVLPKDREYWFELNNDLIESLSKLELDEMTKEGQCPKHHFVAFKAHVNLIDSLLWCSLSRDLGVIQPSIDAEIYIFDFAQQIIIWPYDDRGMDVVGNNHSLLTDLFFDLNHHVIDWTKSTFIRKVNTIKNSTDEQKPEWVTRGKTIRELIPEILSFDDIDTKVKISTDNGETHQTISLVVKSRGACVLMNCEDTDNC